jgi:hypothetical protein
MAIGTPVTMGTGVLASSSTTTVPMTVAGNTAAVGDKVIVAVGNDGGANIPSGVTDSLGNTYISDHAGLRLADNYTIRVFSTDVTTAIGIGDTITGTVDGGGGTWDKFIGAMRVTELLSGSAVDKFASATGASVTPDSGLTATTTLADELVVGVMAAGGAPSSTGGGPLTAAGSTLTRLHNLNASNFIDFASVYKIVSVTGTYKADGTWQASDNWGCIVLTYKGLTGAPGPDADQYMPVRARMKVMKGR